MNNTIIETRSQFDTAISKISKERKVVADVETSGLKVWLNDRICGVGVCLEDRNGYYFPFRHIEPDLPLLALLETQDNNLPLSWIQEIWEALYQVPIIVGHNIKFDLAAMYQDGFDLRSEQKLEDTIVGARLYFKGRYDKLSLDNLSNKLLGEMPWKKEFQAYLKKNGWQHHYDRAPVDKVGNYCIEDTRATYDCLDELLHYIKNTEQEPIWKQESELIRESLWEMEKIGLYFDLEYCEDRLPKMATRAREIEKQLFEIWGREIEIGSEKQLTEAMLDIGISSKSYTASGKPQWDQGELLTMEHPVGGILLEWRGIDKQRSTYFEPLLNYRSNRRVHPSFKSWGTITGRLSCVEPNLQNLTKGFIDLNNNDMLDDEAMDAIKAKLSINKAGSATSGSQAATGTLTGFMSYGKKYDDLNPETAIATRRLYVPPPDYYLYMIDFSQMEMRVFADYVNDPKLNEMLESTGADFHDIVAMEVWNVDKSSSMWKFYRTMAKCINFGLLYGIGEKKLAGQMQCTVDEAREFKTRYFQRFPKAELFMREVQSRILSRGYVVNRFSRRYYIDQEGAYRGVNYLIQGTSADIVKNRMVGCSRFLVQPHLRIITPSSDETPDFRAYQQRNQFIEKLNGKSAKTQMIVQVHDELVFYVHKDEEHWIVKELKGVIEERCIKTFLPTEVSKGFPSWAQKKTVCVECMGIKEEESHDCHNSKSVLGLGLGRNPEVVKNKRRKFKLEVELV